MFSFSLKVPGFDDYITITVTLTNQKFLWNVNVSPMIHLFLSLTVHGGGGPEVGGVTRLGGVRKEPSSTCNLTTRLTHEQETC